MSTVSLARVPDIVQGAGALQTLGESLAGRVPRASPVLLAADPGLKPAGYVDAAAASLAAAGFGVVPFTDIKSDPTMAQVDAAVLLARRERAAAVVALGGGSALDVGKAIAGIAGGSAGAAHYGLCANPFPATRLVAVCVPTTSGTGSEATRTAVLADPSGAKVWLWGDELKPALIVLDPELTTALPAALTAATGIDALVHAIEASTNANANAANDLYCHQAIRLIVRHLTRAVESPRDLEARAALQWAATLAGIGIDNCGTAIAHNIGHALASLRPVHHGRAVGLALRATLAWNCEADADGRFAAVAALMGAGADARRLPEAFDRLLRQAGVKVSLAGEGHDGVTAAALARQMARPENEAMRRSNRRPVADADLLTFATAVLGAR
ncbi:MAG TPA: iron-containing alcohol dehydrogenase [Steroidobacteraceae bacterium]|nr:iron-containing alcohol dehydrogenase [Steroidobacteraceae bacterium]